MGNHAPRGCRLFLILAFISATAISAIPAESAPVKTLEASCRKQKIKTSEKKPSPAKKTKKLSKVKESTPKIRYGTTIHELKNAPYPYNGKYGDTQIPFFDYIDPQTRERFHTNAYGERFAEATHYRDRSVVVHIPPHFNPKKPFTYVVFFHGIPMDVRQCVADYHLTEQVNSSGKNVIFIAPQLAKNAFDTSPGKFFRKAAFRAFMREMAEILSHDLGKRHRKRLDDAPIILTAFSGGYKSVAYILDRGSVDARIQGIFLLDALYEEVGKFDKWMGKSARRSFLVHIYTEGSCAENTALLADSLRRRHLHCRTEWPKKISKGEIYFIQSSSDHMKIPVDGPPADPLSHLLHIIRP